MKAISSVSLRDVQDVYAGPEGRLWELIMGEQIHIGGFQSSMDLAERAGIGAGMRGVDFCCCTGAGMRFLVSQRGVAAMTGVDATEAVIRTGQRRCAEGGFDRRITLVLANACESGLPSGAFDFAWGEDAWCYVADKPRLIVEAARLIKPDAVIAFTDWIEGDAGLSEPEAARYMSFMKFPSLLTRREYASLLEKNGCRVIAAEDTGRFARYVDLYIGMIEMQMTYDVLRILGFDAAMLSAMAGEMAFMRELAHAGKIAQGLFVARKAA